MNDDERAAVLAAAVAKAGVKPKLDIVGAHEARRMLRVSNQRFHLIRKTDARFPQPDAKLQATPVWQGATMRAYAKARRARAAK